MVRDHLRELTAVLFLEDLGTVVEEGISLDLEDRGDLCPRDPSDLQDESFVLVLEVDRLEFRAVQVLDFQVDDLFLAQRLAHVIQEDLPGIDIHVVALATLQVLHVLREHDRLEDSVALWDEATILVGPRREVDDELLVCVAECELVERDVHEHGEHDCYPEHEMELEALVHEQFVQGSNESKPQNAERGQEKDDTDQDVVLLVATENGVA